MTQQGHRTAEAQVGIRAALPGMPSPEGSWPHALWPLPRSTSAPPLLADQPLPAHSLGIYSPSRLSEWSPEIMGCRESSHLSPHALNPRAQVLHSKEGSEWRSLDYFPLLVQSAEEGRGTGDEDGAPWFIGLSPPKLGWAAFMVSTGSP